MQADMRKVDARPYPLDFRKPSWLFFGFQVAGNQVENAGLMVSISVTSLNSFVKHFLHTACATFGKRQNVE